LLERLLAEQLDPAEDGALTRHIEECASCQALLGELTGGDPRNKQQVPGDKEGPSASSPSPGTASVAAGRADVAEGVILRLKGQLPGRAGLVDTQTAPRPAADARKLPEVPGYEVLEEVGRGGMGVIYRSRQLGLNRVVALKMLRAGAPTSGTTLARLRVEAGAVARLHHPNIVQIYEVGEHAGQPFLALEFVEGGSLRQRLDGTPRPPREAAALVETVARAVEAAHAKGIIHRDLKPANILLQFRSTKDEGRLKGAPATALASGNHPLPIDNAVPKVADFGVAKLLDSDPALGEALTKTGEVLGTPSYMAPEQTGGKGAEIGPATDVYSLGVILYELLTGRVPLRGETTLDTLLLVLGEEPIPPRRLQPRVPRDLEIICLRCLEKSPRKRYASAQELADDLRRFLHGEPIRARPIGAAERLWRWCRRRPVAASLLMTLVLGSALALAYLSRLSQEVVRTTALESAAQQAELFDELNDFYSEEVVGRVKPFGVVATHAYKTKNGTIPIPATLTIDLGQYISDRSRRGMQIRLYSDAPFLSRKEGGPRDDFEREALDSLRANPGQPYSRFEEVGGRFVLRFATARTMKESCVECHNSHPDSPRHDWKVGDVRGILEVIRPLDQDEERAGTALRGTFVLIGGLCVALLLVSSLVLFLGRRSPRL
jgi:serine/threonine protein kinase